MPSPIDTSKIKWKYFELNDKGEVISSDSKPESKNPLAIINTSLFFSPKKSDVPAIMRQNIATMLNHELSDKSKAGHIICIAVPCDDLEKMKAFYGKDNLPLGADLEPYIALKMTDDLAKGNGDYNPHLKDDRMAGSLPAKESAEQLASAVELGYNILSYGGGNTGHQTFEMAQKYFDENHERLKGEGKLQKRVLFGGFSNGTTGSFALRGIINPFLGFTFGWLMASKRMAEDKEDEGLLDHRNTQIDALVHAVEGKDAKLPERNFKCDDLEILEQIEQRQTQYQAKIGKECETANLACYSGQLVPASTGNLSQFADDEMIILGLESFQDKSPGFEPHAALRRFLTSGKINPDQILFIEIGDIIRSLSPTNKAAEMFDLPRKDGFIPELSDLREEEKKALAKCTKAWLEESGRKEEWSDELMEEYRKFSNGKTREAIEKIKAVSAEFKIPIVKEMGRGIGHGKYCDLVPTDYEELKFDRDSLTISQTPILTSAKEAKKPIPAFHECSPKLRLKSEQDLTAEEAEKSQAIKSELDKDLQIAKISGRNLEGDIPKDVIIATPLQLIDLDSKEIEGKDIAIYSPLQRGFIPGQEQLVSFLSFLAKSSDHRPRSITIIPRFNHYEGRNYDADMANRDANYAQLIEDMLGEDSLPIFMSHTSVDLDKFGNFEPVECQLKLHQPSPSPTMARRLLGTQKDGYLDR